MKSKKKIWIGVAIGGVLAILIAICVWLGVQKASRFDAKGYVCAILDHSFKGKTSGMKEVVEGKSEKELLKQYEDSVTDFMKKRVMPGVDMDKETEAKYVALCKEIFQAMKYEVKEEKKIEKGKYEVVVEYQVADILPKFDQHKAEVMAKVQEKVDKIEYIGDTEEEIKKQIEADVLNGFYEILKKSYQEVQYGEKQIITFVVEKNEKGLYTMGTQLNEFLLKITGEDEKQD